MTRQVTNASVAEALDRHAVLLEVAGESGFRGRAFARAAATLRDLDVPVTDMAAAGRLREIPGVGEGIAAAIAQFIATGTFDAHEDLTARFPESLGELLTVPGIGAKTAQRLYSALGIHDLTSLEAALVDGSIASTKGLGGRIEKTVRDGLAEVKRRTGRVPLAVALPAARNFEAAYGKARPQDRISLAGSARRWEVAVGDLDFVVASDDPEASIAAISALPQVAELERTSDSSLRFTLSAGLAADVFFSTQESWGSTLVRATGNAEHLNLLGQLPVDASTEEAVYAARGLPLIPPELRQGREEFNRWGEIPSLVTLSDVNGEFHAHTTWSDGVASIEEMANAAADRGYSVLGITDHSHGLGVAGGLDTERLDAQRREISALGAVRDVTLLSGAEVEVLRDGSLDYDDATLAALDVVVASLHTGLRQPREQLTDRLLGVLQNSNVDIIAHPSGRLIERRQGGDFDWDRVFAMAAQTGTALEINADPMRLDLDPSLAQRASQAGCLITVNCDAHSPAGFSLMEYGIAMARRAWLKPDQILNCWPRDRVLSWLAERGT
jgi:DNA polymerase (family 10)